MSFKEGAPSSGWGVVRGLQKYFRKREEQKKLRKEVFLALGISLSKLTDLISRTMERKVELVRFLGRGCYNLAILSRVQGQEAEAVLRVPLEYMYWQSWNYACAGCWASTFARSLGLPVPREQMLVEAHGRSMSAFKWLSSVDYSTGVELCSVWDKGDTETRKRLIRGIAKIVSGLKSHPFGKIGELGPGFEVGPMDTFLTKNIGPFTTWFDYAETIMRGASPSALHSGLASLSHNLDICLRHFGDLCTSADDGKFYLIHPDLHMANMLVCPETLEIVAVLDWDGSYTGTARELARCPKSSFEGLSDYYVECLRSLGEHELCQLLDEDSPARFSTKLHHIVDGIRNCWDTMQFDKVLRGFLKLNAHLLDGEVIQ